jgi:hypothetical protein
MPSDPNTINYLLSGALAAIISGFILLVNNLVNNHLNNKSQSKREEKQHTRQLEREEIQRSWQLEREKIQRSWQEKSEQQKWYREKIYDSYRASIKVLTKIIQIKIEIRDISIVTGDNNTAIENKNATLSNLRIEFTSEFSIVIAGHPDKESEEFKKTTDKIYKETFGETPWLAGNIITKIMENDSRIKNINE